VRLIQGCIAGDDEVFMLARRAYIDNWEFSGYRRNPLPWR
jgi:hypothetical protein